MRWRHWDGAHAALLIFMGLWTVIMGFVTGQLIDVDIGGMDARQQLIVVFFQMAGIISTIGSLAILAYLLRKWGE
jgi:hypothetical protein